MAATAAASPGAALQRCGAARPGPARLTALPCAGAGSGLAAPAPLPAAPRRHLAAASGRAGGGGAGVDAPPPRRSGSRSAPLRSASRSPRLWRQRAGIARRRLTQFRGFPLPDQRAQRYKAVRVQTIGFFTFLAPRL